MRVLLADNLPDLAIARLEAAGDDVVLKGDITADELPGTIFGFEVLVVRSTEVTAATLEVADQLGLIVRAGAGINTIDHARAAELGIYVCNVPGRNALAVAELTLGLLLAIDRHIAAATADLRAGTWNKSAYSRADGLYGRRLAIVGLGDIGIAVAERATGFGLDVVALAKPTRSADAVHRAQVAGISFIDELDELLSTSDIVSLHVPARSDTKAMVDAAFLARMKDGAILLNTSRGDIVDEEALIAAMDERGLRAGLDVFANEPDSGSGEFDSRLARHPNVVATHHIGASTQQAQVAVADGTIDAIDAYRQGVLIGCVNMEETPLRAATLIIRHRYRVGVLAAILAELRAADINVSNMHNEIFAGAKTAVATINVDVMVDDAVLADLNALDHVINASVTPVTT